ncbi:MAG: hypothetical protein HY664_08800 [Chloroflexi bacterium]|nr:hypothetical protein [Chloroflexota bacterium]
MTYQDNEYQSESITFASGETAKTVEVTVYESTTSDENVKVEANYVVIFPEKGQLQVRELVRIVNTGDHTYVGSKVMEADPTKKETLRFLLPDSARELSYDQGLMECCVFKAEQGFVDTMGVLPGVKEIDFGYRLPYSPPQYDFLKTVAYPTDDLVVLIHGTGVQATSSDLVEEGPTDLGGDQFLVLSRADVGKDTQITTTLYGLPQGDSQKALRWAGTTLAVLAAGFGLGYPILRRRQKRAGGEDRQLLLELASLDDAFAAGSIAEEEYRRLRAEKKEQLLQQWRGSSRDNL